MRKITHLIWVYQLVVGKEADKPSQARDDEL